MALAEQKTDLAEARLAAISIPQAGAWLSEARNAAAARLRRMGLPVGRDEYWRYTRPDTLTSVAPVAAAVFDAQDEVPIFAEIETLHIVFVDGVFDAEESDDLTGENLEVARLAEAGQADIHWAQQLFGQLEAAAHTHVDRPLAALNTAIAPDGMLIRVTGPVTKPVHITYRHRDEHSDACLHHVIRLEAGSSLTLLENGPAAARFNKVMEVEIADRAAFHHIRAQGRDHERRAATHIFARLGTESRFKSFTLTANGVMTRNECVIDLQGDNAAAHVAGAALGDGDFHHDDTVFVTHDALNCESRQVFKKVLRNGATGVFQGKILVKEGAQKTDGYQISQSLLLDDDSVFLAKPELEIYADDVACSHGSTTGAIDETALYYLRSRGIPRIEAQDMLVLSFLAEAIDEIEDPDISAEIILRLQGWLARHRH